MGKAQLEAQSATCASSAIAEVALQTKVFKICCALIVWHFQNCFRSIPQFNTLNLVLFHFDGNIDKCPPFLAKYLLFSSKKWKKRYLHCVMKFQLRNLGCTLTWHENAFPQLPDCVALQLNQKGHCGSWAALQKLKKN